MLRTALAAVLVLGLACANWIHEPEPARVGLEVVYRTDVVRALLARNAGPAPPEPAGRP